MLSMFGRPASWSLGAVALIAALATCGTGGTASSGPASSGPDPSVQSLWTPPASAPALVQPASSAPGSSSPGSSSPGPDPAGPDPAGTDQPDPDQPDPDPPGGDPPGTVDPGQQIAGTDARAMAPVAPTPAIEAALVEFGRLHLSYRHDHDVGARIEALRPLVTPDLLVVLAQPLPPALVELLAAEQRMVDAEPLGIEPIDGGTYLVSFAVRTTALAMDGSTPSDSSASGGPLQVSEETRTLLITVDAEGRVSDVR